MQNDNTTYITATAYQVFIAWFHLQSKESEESRMMTKRMTPRLVTCIVKLQPESVTSHSNMKSEWRKKKASWKMSVLLAWW